MKRFLEIAKITSTHGIRGEVRCTYYCDTPDVLCSFEELYLDRGAKKITAENAYPHKSGVIMKLEGVDSIEDARPLIGKMLYIDREDAQLGEDVFFIQDMIGLTVKDCDTGEVYGRISEVYQNGAADVFSIKKEDGRELMFPNISEVVISTDIEGGEMLIRPLKGLFNDEN